MRRRFTKGEQGDNGISSNTKSKTMTRAVRDAKGAADFSTRRTMKRDDSGKIKSGKPQCKALTVWHGRCRNAALDGNYCWTHQKFGEPKRRNFAPARLNDEEFNYLKEAARAAGVANSEYLRRLLERDMKR